MAGFPITGYDPNDPIAEAIREILFAQNIGGGGSQSRAIVLVANKTSDGTATTNTLYGPAASAADWETLFGKRSEMRWGHHTLRLVNQNIDVYGIAVPEGGSATAASKPFVFASASTGVTTVLVEWGGESVEVPVADGDSAATIATNVRDRINQEVYWPWTAGVSTATLTATAANLGPRGDLTIDRIRITLRKDITTTITPGSLTAGTVADDVTTALSKLDAATIHYHVGAMHATAGVTTTDNGIGEYCTFIKTAALPNNGKEQTVGFGLVGTQAQATSVATSTAANSARAVFFRAENSDWTPFMVACHCMGVKASAEASHPGANLSGYTNTDATPFFIPDPFNKDDRPTRTEIRADLNNGITPIVFSTAGVPSINRQVTSYSAGTVAGTKDYRAREGHIPSVADYFWQTLKSRYMAQRQNLPFIGEDPVQGAPPLQQYATPSWLRGLIMQLLDDATGPFIGNAPLLDPSVLVQMKQSVQIILLPDGFSARVGIAAVRHNNKWQQRIEEQSVAS